MLERVAQELHVPVDAVREAWRSLGDQMQRQASEAEETGLRVTLLARAEEAKAGAMENTGEQEDSQAAADYKIAALHAAANEKAAALQVC